MKKNTKQVAFLVSAAIFMVILCSGALNSAILAIHEATSGDSTSLAAAYGSYSHSRRGGGSRGGGGGDGGGRSGGDFGGGSSFGGSSSSSGGSSGGSSESSGGGSSSSGGGSSSSGSSGGSDGSSPGGSGGGSSAPVATTTVVSTQTISTTTVAVPAKTVPPATSTQSVVVSTQTSSTSTTVSVPPKAIATTTKSVVVTQSTTTSVVPVVSTTTKTSVVTVITTTPAVVATTTSVVVNPPVSAITTKNPMNYKVGFSVGTDIFSLSQTDLDAYLDNFALLGAGWVRVDFEWAQIQRNNSSEFDWTFVDRLVNGANARGIKILPVIAYAPAWARMSECATVYACAPASAATFGVYAKALATRYASKGIHTWEIWNEPNTRAFWQPAPNPVAYAALLKSASSAIKSVDPSAVIVTAGLAPSDTSNGNYSPVDFVKAIYANGAKTSFDALGFHPYSYPALPSTFEKWNAWTQMEGTDVSLRSVMADNGDSGKKIWMTEYGAPTGGPRALATATNLNYKNQPDHVDDALQSQMIYEAILANKSISWAGPIFLYSYKDLGTSTDTNENFFGIIRKDGSTKPTYSMLHALLSN